MFILIVAYTLHKLILKESRTLVEYFCDFMLFDQICVNNLLKELRKLTESADRVKDSLVYSLE